MQFRGNRPLLLTEDTSWLTGPAATAAAVVTDLEKMIVGRDNLTEHIVTGPSNIDLMALRLVREPGTTLTPDLIDSFCQGFSELDGYDYFLLDIGGGLTQTALSCCLSPCDSILVATTESRVLNQTLRLLKALSANGFHDPLKLVIMQAKNKQDAEETYILLEEILSREFHIPLEYLGYVGQLLSEDINPPQTPLLLELDEKRGEYFKFLTGLVEAGNENFHSELTPEVYLARMIELLSYPLQIPPAASFQKASTLPAKLELSLNNGEILPLLKAISEQIGTVGGELAQIRKMFETEVSAFGEKGPGGKAGYEAPGIIPLDLEAFAAQWDKGESDDES